MVSPPWITLGLLATLVRADFFVSLNGSDTAAGTAHAPFKSFERAQKAVRGVVNTTNDDVKVYIAPGTYYLDEPLLFTDLDSGNNGHTVIWEAQDMDKGVNISGGAPITNWTLTEIGREIYSAPAPSGLRTRHFYADQKHAQRAHHALNRTWLANNTEGYWIINDQAEFLLTMEGLEQAEIHGLGSFTTRFSPISHAADNKTLIMKQPAWNNNAIGYDTISRPDVSHGFFVENALALLDEENEWYLNTTSETVYYKPPNGTDIRSMYLVLGRLEQLLVVGGTYDKPAHDITFRGFNYMHSTWNLPSGDVGYVDQQTGGFIGLDESYTVFESSRPYWWQVPGAIQVSAANNILFQNGSLTASMGGFGIGNDANAHATGVGLGTSTIEISGMYLHQTGTNAISMGGIQADAHHPTNPRMINKDNRITENIFADVAKTFNSGVAVFVSYTARTQITHNDVSNVPYSGICYGYGWGSNDAGGSPEYLRRGLYNYQPIYDSPTVMSGGIISRNLINNFGVTHSDLGGIYTLSASPNTTISENWVFNSPNGAAIYNDEGSRFYHADNSVFNTTAFWLQRNERTNYTTGNMTYSNIASTIPFDPALATNQWGDRLINITQWTSFENLTQAHRDVVFNAGIPVGQREGRPVSVNQERF